MNAKLKACPACERLIARDATKCPQCGKSMTTASRLVMLIIIGVILGWFLLAAMGVQALLPK